MGVVIISNLELLVDDEDAVKIAEWGPWNLNSSRKDRAAGRFYFAHNLPEIDGKRKCVKLHRVIAGAEIWQIVDHINGNTLDCRKQNLRVVDTRTNVINASRYKDHRSVTFEANKKLWRARINVNGKCVSLGRFKNIEDAKSAYAESEHKYGYAGIRSGRIA